MTRLEEALAPNKLLARQSADPLWHYAISSTDRYVVTTDYRSMSVKPSLRCSLLRAAFPFDYGGDHRGDQSDVYPSCLCCIRLLEKDIAYLSGHVDWKTR